MAIGYQELLSCAYLKTMAVALHDVLITAGWTIVYADADAIGTGSSGSPAWDKTPATTTTAGRTIYEMSAATASVTRYVEIEWRWGSAVTEWCPIIDLGTGFDGSTAITGGIGARGLTDLSAAINGSDAWVAAHPDGFAFASMTRKRGTWPLISQSTSMAPSATTCSCTSDRTEQSQPSGPGIGRDPFLARRRGRPRLRWRDDRGA